MVKRLGIMTAMEEEFRLIAESVGASKTRQIGPRTFLSASCDGLEITLVPSRIGKVAAAVTSTLLIHEYDVDAILFTGVAGAADPAVRIGDIVVADSLVQHDIDLKGVLGYQRFDIPLLNKRDMACDPALVAVAQQAARAALSSHEYTHGVRAFTSHQAQVHTGTIASGDTFVCDNAHRDSLTAAIPGLRCVEMEGASMAQVCVEHGVPFVVARVISDEASHEAHIDFGAFIAQAAAVGSGLFVRHFVEQIGKD